MWLTGIVGASIFAAILLFTSLVGINDSGKRQFVQTVTGSTKVVLTEGPYALWFGNNFEYNDFLTYDFTGPNGRCEYENGDGLKVQYQDGGYGVICGQVRFPLPDDVEMMKEIHRAYRSEEGVRNKLVDKTLRDISTIIASLITSTEAYTTKRPEVQRMFEDQLRNGTYLTTVETRDVVIAMDDDGVAEVQEQDFPIILVENGVVQKNKSKLADLGINNVEISVTGFDFEDKTLSQIADRRDATNRAMTAKDKAKAAYWEKEQTEAEGEKNVAEAKYKELTLAQTKIQQSQRDKTLAIIEAEKQKEQAIELTLAAKEEEKKQIALALAAVAEARKIKVLADAESYKLRETQKGGELKLRLDNELAIAQAYAHAMSTMKSPETLILGGSDGTTGSVETLVQFKAIEQAKTLAAQSTKKR